MESGADSRGRTSRIRDTSVDVSVQLQDGLRADAARGPEGIPSMVEAILQAGLQLGASDVHIDPTAASLDIRFRLDGVLVPGARVDRRSAAGVVARLKVLAELLTYRNDVPQEGRLRTDTLAGLAGMFGGVDLRLATFPTVHGEKAVVRIFDPARRLFDWAELGMPDPVGRRLEAALADTSGATVPWLPGCWPRPTRPASTGSVLWSGRSWCRWRLCCWACRWP